MIIFWIFVICNPRLFKAEVLNDITSERNEIENLTVTMMSLITDEPEIVKAAIPDPVVAIQEGKLLGSYKKKYYSFTGIKYGKAPIGNQRFKPAQPEGSWEGVRNAQKFGSTCSQVPMITRVYTGSEDCLFLNVFTKHLPQDTGFTKYMPVMFWIHGGAFKAGSGNFPVTGPDYLVSENVVLVTINYRLGPLGFLCLNEDVPGNAGIHDQILALKWVQRNIKAFGGDPNKVTIFGFSAGATSVEILTLSPATKGLFRSAIAQSGSVLNPWSFVIDPKKQAYRLARELGFNASSEEELINFLKNVSVKNLVEKAIKMETPAEERNAMDINFTPCIETHYKNKKYQPILPEHPLNILKKGNYHRIPYIAGHVIDEGLLIFKNVLINNKLYNMFKSSNLYFIPSNLDITEIEKNEVKLLANDISYIYLGLQSNITKSKMLQYLVKYGTDAFFAHGITRTLRIRVENGDKNVYSYQFAFNGEMNFYKRFLGVTDHGIGHGGELGYLFTAPTFMYLGIDTKPDSKDMIIKNRMVKMWTNFAKYGYPTPKNNWNNLVEWQPITSAYNFTYLNINEKLEQFYRLPHAERILFWDEIYKEYDRKRKVLENEL